jgi:hypothetical protein
VDDETIERLEMDLGRTLVDGVFSLGGYLNNVRWVGGNRIEACVCQLGRFWLPFTA